jgi:flagellar biosynthetic protein FliP
MTQGLTAAPTPATGVAVGNESIRVAIQLTFAALLPLAVLAFTPFLRVSTVLYFLRQALGIPNIPSNQIIIVLSLLLTYGIMKPTVDALYAEAIDPYVKGQLAEEKALELGKQRLRARIMPYAGESEIQVMLKIAKQTPPASRDQLGFDILAGAYVLSELKTSFRMGAMIYIPFLIIDLVVSALVVALGMIQLPPALVSTPLKILVFVLADGWVILLQGLSESFKAN